MADDSNYTIEQGIKEHQVFILKQCLHFARNMEEAKILRSDAYEKVWKNREDFNGRKSDFCKWVYVIVRNCYIDEYRKARTTKRRGVAFTIEPDNQNKDLEMWCDASNLSTTFQVPYQVLIVQENLEERLTHQSHLKNVLYTIEHHLPPNFPVIFREVFELRFLFGLKEKEVALAINLPLRKVQVCTQKMRSFLKKPGNIKSPGTAPYEYIPIHIPRTSGSSGEEIAAGSAGNGPC